jgi:hypothetical protein
VLWTTTPSGLYSEELGNMFIVSQVV